MTEYVYVIGVVQGTVVKIGRSTDVEGRFKDIQAMSPIKLELLWHAEGDSSLEAALHRQFKVQRLHGEWFDLGDDDVVTVVEQAVDVILNPPPRPKPRPQPKQKATPPASAAELKAEKELVFLMSYSDMLPSSGLRSHFASVRNEYLRLKRARLSVAE